MKKVWAVGTAAGLMCASGGCFALPLWFEPQGNLALYGSYMSQNDGLAGTNPDGGGGGAQVGLSLTRNFFIGGSYQYDYISQSNAPASSFNVPGGLISYGEKVNQARVGGGVVVRPPGSPLDVYGKLEYVHFDYQTVNATVDGMPVGNSSRSNDDGVGVHVGLQSRLPGVSVYGSIGYLSLSNSSGPELNLGVELPLAPLLWGFLEYRYDDLGYNNYSDHNEINDVRAGVRLSF